MAPVTSGAAAPDQVAIPASLSLMIGVLLEGYLVEHLSAALRVDVETLGAAAAGGPLERGRLLALVAGLRDFLAADLLAVVSVARGRILRGRLRQALLVRVSADGHTVDVVFRDELPAAIARGLPLAGGLYSSLSEGQAVYVVRDRGRRSEVVPMQRLEAVLRLVTETEEALRLAAPPRPEVTRFADVRNGGIN